MWKPINVANLHFVRHFSLTFCSFPSSSNSFFDEKNVEFEKIYWKSPKINFRNSKTANNLFQSFFLLCVWLIHLFDLSVFPKQAPPWGPPPSSLAFKQLQTNKHFEIPKRILFFCFYKMLFLPNKKKLRNNKGSPMFEALILSDNFCVSQNF